MGSLTHSAGEETEAQCGKVTMWLLWWACPWWGCNWTGGGTGLVASPGLLP